MADGKRTTPGWKGRQDPEKYKGKTGQGMDKLLTTTLKGPHNSVTHPIAGPDAYAYMIYAKGGESLLAKVWGDANARDWVHKSVEVVGRSNTPFMRPWEPGKYEGANLTNIFYGSGRNTVLKHRAVLAGRSHLADPTGDAVQRSMFWAQDLSATSERHDRQLAGVLKNHSIMGDPSPTVDAAPSVKDIAPSVGTSASSKIVSGPGTVTYGFSKRWAAKYSGNTASVKSPSGVFGDSTTALRNEYYNKQAIARAERARHFSSSLNKSGLAYEGGLNWSSRSGAASESYGLWATRSRGVVEDLDLGNIGGSKIGFNRSSIYSGSNPFGHSAYYSVGTKAGSNIREVDKWKVPIGAREHEAALHKRLAGGASISKDKLSNMDAYDYFGGTPTGGGYDLVNKGFLADRANRRISNMSMEGSDLKNNSTLNNIIDKMIYLGKHRPENGSVVAVMEQASRPIKGGGISGVNGMTIHPTEYTQRDLDALHGGNSYLRKHAYDIKDGPNAGKYTSYYESWSPKRSNIVSNKGFISRLRDELTGNIPEHRRNLSAWDRVMGGGGGRSGSGDGRGGSTWSQAKTQFRHAAIWQAYTPVIAAAGYATYRAFTGDPGTDRAAHGLIGVDATSQQRAQARDWAYRQATATPFSSPSQYLKVFKEVASGIGLKLNKDNQSGLQDAASKARLFSTYSMEDPAVAARRLSRSTLMEANAKGVTSDEGKLGIFNRQANSLAGLYASSSTKGQETDVAMHYMGSVALGKLGWNYEQAAAVNSHFVEQGIAGSTSGVFFRNMAANTAVMKEAAKARMFWEKAYSNQAARGGKELLRKDLPLEYLSKGAWMPNKTMDKKDPEKAARIREMQYRSSKMQSVLGSGDMTKQHTLFGQMSQDWYKIQEAGLHGIVPPQAMQPMVQMIAQQSPKEYAKTIVKETEEVSKNPERMEGARTEDHRIDTPAAAASVIGTGFGEFFANSIFGSATKWFGKRMVASHYGASIYNMVRRPGFKSDAFMKMADKIQMQRNAGVLSDSDLSAYGGALKEGIHEARWASKMDPKRKKDLAEMESVYKKLGGDSIGQGGNFIPFSAQSDAQHAITEKRMRDEGKSIASIIKDGAMQVHIDSSQFDELKGVLGYGSGSVKALSMEDLSDGSVRVTVRKPDAKPETATNPPGNINPRTKQPYRWGVIPKGETAQASPTTGFIE